MPTIWICSAHGGVDMVEVHGRQAVPLLQVPHGVDFWHCSGESMVARPSMAQFDRLILGPKPGQSQAELLRQVGMQKHSGAIPAYTMTFTREWGNDKLGHPSSGIFKAGDPHRRDPASWTPPDGHVYTLKEFFDSGYLRPGDAVAWMCCRVWHSAARSAFMQHQGGQGRFVGSTPPG